jgi:hypothetical protein
MNQIDVSKNPNSPRYATFGVITFRVEGVQPIGRDDYYIGPDNTPILALHPLLFPQVRLTPVAIRPYSYQPEEVKVERDTSDNEYLGARA